MQSITLSGDRFFQAIASPVLYDRTSPYRLMSEELDSIESHYFSGGHSLGKTVDTSIGLEVKERILSDFKSLGAKLLTQTGDVEKAVFDQVQSIVDSYPSREEARADLRTALEKMHHFIRKQLCYIPFPQYSSAEIRELYSKARQITLVERITGSNDADVYRYYHAMIGHCTWACRMLTRRKTSQFLISVVDSLSRQYDLQSPVATLYNDPPSTL